jgi:hypothetical protein
MQHSRVTNAAMTSLRTLILTTGVAWHLRERVTRLMGPEGGRDAMPSASHGSFCAKVHKVVAVFEPGDLVQGNRVNRSLRGVSPACCYLAGTRRLTPPDFDVGSIFSARRQAENHGDSPESEMPPGNRGTSDSRGPSWPSALTPW